MSRRHDRARAARNNSSRHSNTMAAGRGDPREHRRADQGLTDHDLDERFLRLEEGKLTLKLDASTLARLLEGAVGQGIELQGGKLAVKLGATIALDASGALAVRFSDVETLTDNSTGTVGGDTIAAVTSVATAANAIATLAAKVNALLAAASTSIR